jgi:hypothetical protein
MHKYEYRCNHCMIIEQKWVFDSATPSEKVPCWKCGGSAERIITYQNMEVNKSREPGIRRLNHIPKND